MRETYPGIEAESVILKFRKSRGAVRFTVGGDTKTEVVGANEKMDEAEFQVLGVLPDNDKKGMSAQEVAKKAGYKYNSWLRTILHRLRKKGKAELGSDGYKRAK